MTTTISLVPPLSYACVRDSAPSALRLVGPDEYGVMMTGGAIVVDGVTITQRGPQLRPELKVGKEYLLQVVACPGHAMTLPYDGLSVFEVGEGGRLSTEHGLPLPFAKVILSLGTVDAVAASVKKR